LGNILPLILQPRKLNYKIQFTGPTGTNAVEAALKIARKVTGRRGVISFTNAFHGVSLGSLAVTGNSYYKEGSRGSLSNVTFMPYDGYFGDTVNTIDYLRCFIEDKGSGVDLPAAVIVETIQGEGGINVASNVWLHSLYELCKQNNILLIIDDIQVGCGRTGTFFSFEESHIIPDLVVLSKSLSGFGLPFSILLLKPDIDLWKPGEHNGTFRGNNLAFVSSTETLKQFWSTKKFEEEINEKEKILKSELHRIIKTHLSTNSEIRVKGLIAGVDCTKSELAKMITAQSFKNGLILERCGSEDQVIKFLPPLIAPFDVLHKALRIFEESIATVLLHE